MTTITDPVLLAYRARIAGLRRVHHHLTAGIMRDELLSQIEAFIDPDGAAHTQELQAAQGRQAGVLALDVSAGHGF